MIKLLFACQFEGKMLEPLFSKGFVIRVKNDRLANEYET